MMLGIQSPTGTRRCGGHKEGNLWLSYNSSDSAEMKKAPDFSRSPQASHRSWLIWLRRLTFCADRERNDWQAPGRSPASSAAIHLAGDSGECMPKLASVDHLGGLAVPIRRADALRARRCLHLFYVLTRTSARPCECGSRTKCPRALRGR